MITPNVKSFRTGRDVKTHKDNDNGVYDVISEQERSGKYGEDVKGSANMRGIVAKQIDKGTMNVTKMKQKKMPSPGIAPKY